MQIVQLSRNYINNKINKEYFSNIVFNNFRELSNDKTLTHNLETIRKLVNKPDLIFYAIMDKNNMVGYLLGEHMDLQDGRNVYYVTYIYIAKRLRGSGWGNKLMNLFMNTAKRNNVKFVVLMCDTKDKRIMNFYRKLGFTPDVMRRGTPHDVMSARVID